MSRPAQQRTATRRTIIIAIVAVLGLLLFWFKFLRYRFESILPKERTADMASKPIEGYTDKYFYQPGETITFYLHSERDSNHLTLFRSVGPYALTKVLSQNFTKVPQPITTTQSVEGCQWQPTLSLPVPAVWPAGYYRALLTSANAAEKDSSWITFIVGSADTTPTITVLAPVTTWTAYNPWGGKSLYQNAVDGDNVNFVSTLRPNTAFENNHDLEAEMNIFNWFAAHYQHVAIVPDYMLEERSEQLRRSKVLVLAYHNEYFSKAMYDELEHEIKQEGKSLLAIGANQLYWKVRWHKNHTQLECHKDLTFFKDPLSFGGMWRHNLRFMERLIGVGSTGKGMHTYAPYKVLIPNHWLYNGLQLQPGELFGASSINGGPLSGAEVDQSDILSGRVEIIAHGLNRKERRNDHDVYSPNDPSWDGKGGADLAVKYFNDGKNAVLSTGSIQSGAGLGSDTVFTRVIENFLARYAKP